MLCVYILHVTQCSCVSCCVSSVKCQVSMNDLQFTGVHVLAASYRVLLPGTLTTPRINMHVALWNCCGSLWGSFEWGCVSFKIIRSWSWSHVGIRVSIKVWQGWQRRRLAVETARFAVSRWGYAFVVHCTTNAAPVLLSYESGIFFGIFSRLFALIFHFMLRRNVCGSQSYVHRMTGCQMKYDTHVIFVQQNGMFTDQWPRQDSSGTNLLFNIKQMIGGCH